MLNTIVKSTPTLLHPSRGGKGGYDFIPLLYISTFRTFLVVDLRCGRIEVFTYSYSDFMFTFFIHIPIVRVSSAGQGFDLADPRVWQCAWNFHVVTPLILRLTVRLPRNLHGRSEDHPCSEKRKQRHAFI